MGSNVTNLVVLYARVWLQNLSAKSATQNLGVGALLLHRI
jgi:hypothetical protein